MTLIFQNKALRTNAITVAVLLAIGGCTNQQVKDTGNTVPANNTTPVCCNPAPATNTSTTNTNTGYDVTTQSGAATTASNTNNTTPVANTTTTTTVATTTPQVSAPDGRPSVQVLAAAAYGTAQQMLQRIQSAGYNAVIVQIAGLYKVRVPYNSYEEARANLGAIRGIAPDAFVATQ